MSAPHAIAPVRSVMLYPREDGAEAPVAVDTVTRFFQDRGGRVTLPSELVSTLDLDVPPGCDVIDGPDAAGTVDLMIALGGDGTLLRAARLVADHGIPVVGVNLGDLGFLSAYARAELQTGLEAAYAGELVWERRLRLRVQVHRSGRACFEQLACNDMYIKHGEVPRMLQLSTQVAGHHMADYRADGLIICTPTGSTAYNLAAGGPIVSAGTDTVTITPICPHSLTHRPVVVSAAESVRIAYRGPWDGSAATLSVDGQWNQPLEVGDEVVVGGDAIPLKLVPPRATVFEVLATKLGWAGPRRNPST